MEHATESAARVAAAAEALGGLVRSITDCSLIPGRTRRQFRSSSLDQLLLAERWNGDRHERCMILLRKATLLAEASAEDGSRGSLREARIASIGSAISLAECYRAEDRALRHYGALAEGLANGFKIPASMRGRLKILRSGKQGDDLDSDLGASEADLAAVSRLLSQATVTYSPGLLEDLPHTRADSNMASTAELLASGDTIIPKGNLLKDRTADNDLSQRGIALSELAFVGFRGSPTETRLSFNNPKGRPVSCFIMGDNGVGKSTVVDAIELALQGRVGRSVDLASPSRALAINQATDVRPSSTVTLSDGNSVTRCVVSTEDGRTRADRSDVSPGFRLAPITLKRTDILAFLDSAALSRGAVLFDYFPKDASGMARGLEDDRIWLEDQLQDQRTRRLALTEALAALLSIDASVLLGRDAFHSYVSDVLIAEGSPEERLAAWAALDPDIADLVHQLRLTYSRLKNLKRQSEKSADLLNPKKYAHQANELRAVLRDVGDELTQSFRSITRASFVKRIDVVFGKSGPTSIDIVIRLSNDRCCYPKQIFSEGYCDLLALLFFLAVAKEAAKRGQAKVLVLDDVLQSVDSSIRLGAIGHVLTEFKDWQLLITVHDRLWLEQLRGLFQDRGKPFIEHHILSWAFDTGPQFGARVDPTASIRAQIATGDPDIICTVAGRHLESLCDELSKRLNVTVQRRLDDKYTLRDLWDPCAKVLRKTSLRPVVDDLQLRQHLRNLVGAHENAWAGALPLSDANTFAEDVIRLLEGVLCRRCSDWITRKGETMECKCGALVLVPG